MVQAWMVSGFGLIGCVSVLIHLPGRLRPLELRAVNGRNKGLMIQALIGISWFHIRYSYNLLNGSRLLSRSPQED